MDTYSFLRELADSWVLLAMVLFFLATAIWAVLPSQSAAREDARMIPFRDTQTDACSGRCDACPCTSMARNVKGGL